MSQDSTAKPPSIWAVLLGTRRRRQFWTVIALLFLSYQVVKQAGRLGATKLEVTTTSIKHDAFRSHAPLRIAFFADVHDSRHLLRDVVKEVAVAKPDLIVFGGDLVMVGQRMKRTYQLIDMLRELAAIAPTYAILGNQDMERLPEVLRVLDEANIRVLRNERLEWSTPTGGALTIIGLGDWNEGDMKPELCMKKQGDEAKPVLLLSHDPESRNLLKEYDWDIMLSGHTHGGQLANPFTGEYISFRSDMPAGLYSVGSTAQQVYVTRGVGSTFGMRFFCPPEVSIIDIHSETHE